MIKQSFTWWSFSGRGLDDRSLLNAAADIGFAGVEFLPKELRGTAAGLGLSLAAIGGHAIHDGFNQRENHTRLKDEIAAHLDDAFKHKISTIIVFAGNRQPGIGDDEAAEITAAGLSKLVGPAEAAGVTLCLELLNSKRNHAGYQADSTAWGVKVCEKVGSPRVKLLYDIYHMQIMEGDLVHTISQYEKWFGHYHTAGCPGRDELDDKQEINYRAVVKAIATNGYTGWIGHEYLPTREIATGLREAFELTKSQI